MTAKTPVESTTLYDRDYLLWLTATAEQLREKRFDDVDLENLIEEIESIGRMEKFSLQNLLIELLEDLLKLAYWESERERQANKWSYDITVFRDEISSLLKFSPSLDPYLREIFAESYARARRLAGTEMGVKIQSLPETPIATPEQALDYNWFPIRLDWQE